MQTFTKSSVVLITIKFESCYRNKIANYRYRRIESPSIIRHANDTGHNIKGLNVFGKMRQTLKTVSSRNVSK